MADILGTYNSRVTPQSRPADSRQVKNSAGGYVFQVDPEARLRRFLTLGTEGGTYYVSAPDLTSANIDSLIAIAKAMPRRMVDIIVEVSQAGRAPKQNPALFALAVVGAHADSEKDRSYAMAALPKVARTATHLFLFAGYAKAMRGWGPALRKALARWYTDPTVDDLAYQMVKYRSREGWTHGDLLRVAHPKTVEDARTALFRWSLGREVETPALLPQIVRSFERLQAKEITPIEAIGAGLTWEMLPNEALTDAKVWAALVEKGMPQTALIRQLPRLTRLGVLTGTLRTKVVEQITDPTRLAKARVHPVSLLLAQTTYASGHSVRGDTSWTPNRKVIDALDAAFYASFKFVEPTGKRHLLALDVSGSMWSQISGTSLSAAQASAAMALVTMATEQETEVIGFTSGARSARWGGSYIDTGGVSPLSISPRQRLDDVVKSIDGLDFGGTDCALPMLYAIKQGLEVDTFVVYTDSETWAGRIHPHQALEQYRQKTGIAARSIVVGMTATDFTIADPNDPLSLDVAGFDSAVPSLIADFSRGAI